MRSILLFLVATIAFGGLFGLAVLPVSLSLSTDISYACMAALLLLSFVPGKSGRLFFITMCAWVVVRYMSWRFTSVPLDNGIAGSVAAVTLLLAECYGVAMLMLGLFVNAYPLNRKPTKLPKDQEEWPTVDVYIPTYSEPVSVVAPTLLAAMEIDYPRHKFNVYVLDDGHPRSLNSKTAPDMAMELRQRSSDLQALCLKHGATWLTRERNEHAKSGNLNAAMKQTKGEYILVLDADHVPTCNILKNTVGLLHKDEKMAFVQTPHFFVNPDPVERNLGLYNKMPSENDMFYRVVQKGLDLWNASFFCGSAALLRRAAIKDVNGFSVDSITEDASTSIKMHQKGWRSAYLGIPMVAGLQPETFAAFTVQRLRWAMGMMQIAIKQNPWLIRGLTIPQRMAYTSVILFWLFPFARTVFFVAPLASIVFDLPMYPTGPEYFIAFTLPYLLAVILSFERSFGRVRRILISELYETLQAFYTLPALISTLLRPSAPTFKVTPKGERLDREFISDLNRPFYFFYALTVVGLGWGLTRMVQEPAARQPLMLSVAWMVLNFTLLSAALGVLVEKVQRRQRPRITVNKPVTLVGSFGERDALMVDVNEVGALLKVYSEEPLPEFAVRVGEHLFDVAALPRNKHLQTGEIAVKFVYATAAQERQGVLLGYSSSDRWMDMWKAREASRNIFGAIFFTLLLSWRSGFKHIRRVMPKD